MRISSGAGGTGFGGVTAGTGALCDGSERVLAGGALGGNLFSRICIPGTRVMISFVKNTISAASLKKAAAEHDAL